MTQKVILNISQRLKSEIDFDIIKFPDGQQSIKLDIRQNDSDVEIDLCSRFNSFLDLELIILANQTLREHGYTKINLIVPYFLGSRSDRKFEHGTVNYLKTVVCPIINSQEFSSVSVFDAHSDVLEACLNGYKSNDNKSLVSYAIDNIKCNHEDLVLVSPDAGALKKIYNVANMTAIENIVIANKHRDIFTGKILSTEVPIPNNYENKKFVIVDDICDGGRTFVEIAKCIQQRYPYAEIYLVITHGIFSAGMQELNRYFKKIFTTNSIRDYTEGSFISTNDTSKLFIKNVI